MSISKIHIVGAALGLAMATSLAAEDVNGNTVVATVGGTDITIGHLIAMTATLPDQQRNLATDVIFEGVLERLIQQEAVSQSQTEISHMTALQLENERRSLMASEIVGQLADEIEVTEEQVKAAYDAQFADFMPETEYNASHILVETEEEAKSIIEELNGGADFAEMAKTHSTGPTGPNGGNLDWFGAGRMVPAFDTAVQQMETGQISAPVQTRFGWHVIRLNDKRQTGVPALEEMRADLENQVWQQALSDQIATMVDAVSIHRKDVSEIDPGVVNDLSLIAK